MFSVPRNSDSGESRKWLISQTTSGSYSRKTPGRSPRSHASHPRRTISKFSCDIAHQYRARTARPESSGSLSPARTTHRVGRRAIAMRETQQSWQAPSSLSHPWELSTLLEEGDAPGFFRSERRGHLRADASLHGKKASAPGGTGLLPLVDGSSDRVVRCGCCFAQEALTPPPLANDARAVSVLLLLLPGPVVPVVSASSAQPALSAARRAT